MSERSGFCDICGKTLPPDEASCDIRNWEPCRKRANQEIERLKAELYLLHPRVLKLARSGKRFIVIGEHEPYFMAAYAMIRDQEMKQGTWSEEDRLEYAAAQLSAKESSDGTQTNASEP
uniref:Uncharacterized protein n=1 Tax=viral metagenome TaxID=1070528 RepID=A0A6M3KUQ6_9ZZZZ